MRVYLILIAFLITVPARSEETVQSLLYKCEAKIDSIGSIYCIGRIGGMADLMGYNGFLIGKGENSELHRQVSTCTGKPIPTYGALIQVFENWARSHPEHWADNDLTGVLIALHDKWPCH